MTVLGPLTRQDLASLGWSDDELGRAYKKHFGVLPVIPPDDGARAMAMRRRLFDELQPRLRGTVDLDVLGPKIGAYSHTSAEQHKPG